MPGGRRNPNLIEELALALASGRSIAAWAEASGVPPRTARTWAARPECRALVADHRRSLTDCAIGRLSALAAGAVAAIARLAASAESEAVRLSAARALLAEMLNLKDHADLEARIADLEARLDSH